jgi:hypothetical protein
MARQRLSAYKANVVQNVDCFLAAANRPAGLRHKGMLRHATVKALLDD